MPGLCFLTAVSDPRERITRNLAVALIVAASLTAVETRLHAKEGTAALIQQARDKFQPVTGQQVADARAALKARMAELERFVKPSSTNGQKWLKYFQWDALEEQLATDGTPNLEVLGTAIQRLNRDENGLELPKFRAVSDSLRRYRDLLAVSRWENPAAIYGQQLDALANSIEQYRNDPSNANEFALSSQLGIVTAIGQAPELVAAIHQEFGKPNAFFKISAGLLEAAAEPIHRNEPITDNILGTRIRGDACTTGIVKIAPVPSDRAGVLELTSTGHSVTENVGRNGPAIIRSTGHTDFTANKRVELTKDAFASQPAQASATNDTVIHSISKSGGGLGGRMVSKIGWQRARESKHRADTIAADHAEDRIERQFNKEVGAKLGAARGRYENDFRRPLARRGAVPDHIQFSSSRDGLSLEVTQVGREQIAASADPPAAPDGRDMTMQLHESAVNNYSAILLGGATASESEPDQDTKFDVKLPGWLKKVWEERTETSSGEAAASTEGFKPWSLQFRSGRPLSVDFEEDRVKLTLHIARLESGESTPFTNWDVWGTFVPEMTEGDVVLRREGDLDAMPTNLQGELGSRRAAQRNNLLKEFSNRSAQGRGFPTKIEFPQFEPEGALANAGPLQLKEVLSEGGWLTLVWDRANPQDNGQQVASLEK